MSSGDISYVFGDAFDPSSVTPAEDFVPVPAGMYAVLIEEAEIKTTKSGDGKYVKLKMRVIEGVHSKRILFDNINIQNPSQQCVEIGVRTLAALGQSIGLQRISDTSQLVNKAVIVRVSVDGEYNKIKSYSPVSKPVNPSASSSYSPANPSGTHPQFPNAKPSGYSAPRNQANPGKMPWQK